MQSKSSKLRMLENMIKSEVKKQLKEETWADAAKRHGIVGSFDNELLSYMQDLFSAIENIENYPLDRNFPKNKSDIQKFKQGCELLKHTKFGKLFSE